MRKFFKPYSLLLYVLSPLVFFVIGALIAGLTGAAENQGLAGGAIVFFYGLVAAILSLVLSLILVARKDRALIIRVNQILFLVFIITYSVLSWQYIQRRNTEKVYKESTTPFKDRPTTAPVDLAPDEN